MADTKVARAKPMAKSAIYQELANSTGLSKKQISSVLDELVELMKRQLKKGPGVFALPGVLKVRIVHRPARKARMGRNPQTGEEIQIPAKPASKAVKAQALKNLKELVK